MNMKDNDLDDFFRIVRQAPFGNFDPVKWDWMKRRLNDKFHKAHGEMISIIYSVLKDILRTLKNSKTGLQNLGVNNSGLSQKRKVACYVLDVNHPAINAELAAGLGNGAPYDPVIRWDWPINKVTAPAQLWEFEISGRVSLRSFMTGLARHQFALGVGRNSLLVPHRLFLYISDRPATQEEMQNFVVEIKNDYDLFFHLNMRRDGQWPDHQRLLFKVVTHELIGEPVYQEFRNRYAAALQLEGEVVAGRMLEPANNPFINERASIFHPLERYRTFGEYYRLTKPTHKQDMGTHIPPEKWIFDLGMQPKMMMTLKGNEFEISTRSSTMYEIQNPDGDSEGEADECQRRNNRWRHQKEEWVLQHTHNRHFKHMLVFAKK
ncbi:hypothetical protein BJ508DRAFT_337103, partial [Ascobolus immersus RN42]